MSTQIRKNIRKAWDRRVCNPRNRGAWSNPDEIFRLPFPFTAFNFPETVWPYFGTRYNSIVVNSSETYEETKTYTLTYKTPPGFAPFTRTVVEDQSHTYLAAVPRSGIRPYGSAPFTVPPQARIRHASACPYGEGLYDARGDIGVNSDTHYISNPSDTALPPMPAVDTTGSAVVAMSYASDATAIAGLMTPCMMKVGQYFSGPLGMFEPFPRPDQFFLPFPTDEYGVTNPDGSSVEVYYSATFLNNLIAGVMNASTVRNAGSLSDSETYPDPGDPVDTYNASHTWTRTGAFTLLIS